MQTEQVNSESDDALAERHMIRFHLKSNLLPFLSYCASFALLTLIILYVCIRIHVNYVKFERHAWPYPPCINCLLILHTGLMMQSFLSLEIPFLR